jgi:hypothetical protein
MRQGIVFTVLAMGVIAATMAPTAPAEDPGQPDKVYIYSGTLRSIDRQARTISVGAASAVFLQFMVPTDASIIVKKKPKGTLSDLMVGDGIQVKYTDDDGAHVAHQISVLGVKVP